MVAQVHAPAAAPAQATGQHRAHFDVARLQALAISTQAALGAHRVEQHAALHATCSRTLQGLDDRFAHRVVEHQVVQQVHAVFGLVDVGDQRVQ